MFKPRFALSLLSVFVAIAAVPVGSARAQCHGPGWLPGAGMAGVNGRAFTGTAWDPDGPGPREWVLLVSGQFDLAGSQTVLGSAVFDPATQEWSAFGQARLLNGERGFVSAFAPQPDGDLVVSGSFDLIDGTPARNIARWNGHAWTPLGSGLEGTVSELATLPSGDLIAAGDFSNLGSVRVNHIARWDGQHWHELSGGVSAGPLLPRISDLAVDAHGDLYVGGNFRFAGGAPARNIARWDGSAWYPLGAGVASDVLDLMFGPDGELVVGGSFTEAGLRAVNRLAVWYGRAWAPHPSTGFGATIGSMAFDSQGNLWVGGDFYGGISRWNGTRWTNAVGDRIGLARDSGNRGRGGVALMPSGEMYAFGEFSQTLSGLRLSNIARWTGTVWVPLGRGLAGPARILGVERDGTLLATGGFADGSPAGTNRAAWGPKGWTLLPREPSDSLDRVQMLAQGDLVWQRQVDTPPFYPTQVLRRTDAGWIELGEQFSHPVKKFRLLANGDLLAVGNVDRIGSTPVNGLARWNGAVWTALFPSHTVFRSIDPWDAIELPNGDLVVGGDFASVDGVPANMIARWDGTAWSAMGAGFDGAVTELLLDSSGSLIAFGFFTASGDIPMSSVARWNGSAWEPIGSGFWRPPWFVGALPGGRLAALEEPRSGMIRISLWDGSSWSEIGEIEVGSSFSIPPTGMVVLPNNEIAVWGGFSRLGGVTSPYFARYTATGIPTVGLQPSGATKFSPGSAISLSATASPGYQNVSVQWKRDGTPIANGPEGASVGGGAVAGAADTLASPTDGTASTLTISNVQPSDVGDYTATFTNACGSVETIAAKVRCRGDFDGSRFVDCDDFAIFFDLFARGCTDPGQSVSGTDGSCAASADFDGSGFIDADDFVAFVNAFEAGC